MGTQHGENKYLKERWVEYSQILFLKSQCTDQRSLVKPMQDKKIEKHAKIYHNENAENQLRGQKS